MRKPRRIEFEFATFDDKSAIDWNHYAAALEEYIKYLETIIPIGELYTNCLECGKSANG